MILAPYEELCLTDTVLVPTRIINIIVILREVIPRQYGHRTEIQFCEVKCQQTIRVVTDYVETTTADPEGVVD